MISAMNTAISGKADGIAVCVVDPKAFDGPTEKALDAGHPGRRLQRRRLDRQQAARLHRPGSLQLGCRDGPAHRDAGQEGRPHRALHRDARPVQHPAAHRRRAVGAQGQGLQDRRDHDRRRPAGRALEDRRVRPGPLGRQGPVRRRRRLDPGHRADDEEARPAGQGREGRRLRPPADHARPDQERRPGLHDRPAAVPAGLPAGHPALPLQDLRRPHGAVEHEHRTALRDQGQRGSVPAPRSRATRAATRHRSTSRARLTAVAAADDDRAAAGICRPPHSFRRSSRDASSGSSSSSSR